MSPMTATVYCPRSSFQAVAQRGEIQMNPSKLAELRQQNQSQARQRQLEFIRQNIREEGATQRTQENHRGYLWSLWLSIHLHRSERKFHRTDERISGGLYTVQFPKMAHSWNTYVSTSQRGEISQYMVKCSERYCYSTGVYQPQTKHCSGPTQAKFKRTKQMTSNLTAYNRNWQTFQ